MTNPTFPWPMDKPVEDLTVEWDNDDEPIVINHEVNPDFIDYLLTRLKLAEGERDRLKRKVEAAFIEGTSGVWDGDFENWELNYDIDSID